MRTRTRSRRQQDSPSWRQWPVLHAPEPSSLVVSSSLGDIGGRQRSCGCLLGLRVLDDPAASTFVVVFVHLAPESAAKAIRRAGIKPSATPEGLPPSMYAMAVTDNFFASHQWLRELKASGVRTIVGVYFRIPDDEQVWLGHYGEVHRQMTANQAIGEVMHAESAEGFEVLVPRKVTAKEIHKIRHLPQVVGWRHYPGAHGRRPCGCSFCQRDGRPGSRTLRQRYETDT